MNKSASHTTFRGLINRQTLFLIAIIALLLIIGPSTAILLLRTARAEDSTTVPARPQSTPQPLQSCCGQSPEDLDKPHQLAASYYSVRDNLNARLMLNNKGPNPVEVKPTLYSLRGERLEAAPVTVDPESFRNVDLRDLGALPGTAFEEGSLQLFHRGPDLVIGAQLYLVDEAHSLSFDEKLPEFNNAASTRLESVWWIPSRESSIRVILSNTRGETITGAGIINAGTPHPESVEFTLAPHETRVINVERERPGQGPKMRDDVGSASIRHSGAKGSLVARALIQDALAGYSWSAQFYYPEGGRSSGYQGVGLRLGEVNGERLTPVVVARNVGDTPTLIRGRMPYSAHDGSTGVVELPTVQLAPGKAASIDIDNSIKRKSLAGGYATAGLEFEYSTAPGSVMMSAGSVSDNRNQVFRVPMWDVPAQRNGTGGYPWFIEDSSSTTVFIKNVTDKKQNYTFELSFEGGVYSTGVKSVEAGQVVNIDIRSLRDAQTPDEKGRTIPLDASRGKVMWSVRGSDPLALLGRSEQVDLVKGVSSSYACFYCCPNSFYTSWLEPGSMTIGIGGVTTFRGVEQDYNCYGQPGTPYYWGGLWGSSNTDAVTVSGVNYYSANATGVNYGTSTVWGEWPVYWYQGTTENIYFECRTYEYTTTPEAPTEVPCAVPTNFRQTAASDAGNGTLHFEYAWDSSTGNLADLSQCTVGEKVDYDPADIPFPSPPFRALSPPNPTILNVPGADGMAQDNHSTPGPFVRPYRAASITATQIYRYNCPCKSGGAWQTLAGPINIVRSVSQNTDGTWKFTITKSGSSATINPLP